MEVLKRTKVSRLREAVNSLAAFKKILAFDEIYDKFKIHI